MVDFQELTNKLHGCVRTAIYNLRTGKNAEPKYNLGRRLVELEQRTRRRK
jgi:hypothetical protein